MIFCSKSELFNLYWVCPCVWIEDHSDQSFLSLFPDPMGTSTASPLMTSHYLTKDPLPVRCAHGSIAQCSGVSGMGLTCMPVHFLSLSLYTLNDFSHWIWTNVSQETWKIHDLNWHTKLLTLNILWNITLWSRAKASRAVFRTSPLDRTLD